MNARTHILGGIAVASGYALAASHGYAPAIAPGPIEQVLCAPLCVVGSLLPDIDLPNSRLGIKIKPISWLINKFFGHRTFFHSPLFLWLIWYLTKVWAPVYLWVAEAVVLGGISHLFLDMLNKAGIPLFWPIKRHFAIGSIQLDSEGEFVVEILLVLAILGALGSQLVFAYML